MKTKKMVSAILVSCALCALFAGCAQKSTSLETKGKNELKWVFCGPGEQKDSRMVWTEFNEQLDKIMPGVSVDFECIRATEYADRWQLMMSANEPIDIAWTGYSVPFVDEVKKGAYMPLDELIDKYAPELRSVMPETVLNRERINGKLYAVPNYQMEISWSPRYSFALDLVEKYNIDVEGLEKYLQAKETITEDVYHEIEKYLIAFKKGGDMRLGVCPMFQTINKGFFKIASVFNVKATGDDYTLIDITTTPEYKAYIKSMADWYQKGYIRKDILTAYTANLAKTEQDTTDGGYCFMGNGDVLFDRRPSKEELDDMKANNYKNKVPYYHIPLQSQRYIDSGVSSTANTIPRTSKNPKAAIRLISIMNSAEYKDLYNLLIWGIEGTHYKKIRENRIETLDYINQPTSDAPYGLWKWAMGNTFNSYETQSDRENYNDYILELNKTSMQQRIAGFIPDTDPIKNEITQMNAVTEQYYMPLASGALADYEATYQEYLSKLKIAGAEKVREELQNQLDKWVAENKR